MSLTGGRLTAVQAASRAEIIGALLPAVERALTGDGPPITPVAPGAPDAPDPPDAPETDTDRIRAVLGLGRPLEREGVAVVLPTSGSTGEPKAALLSGSALLHSARSTHRRLGGPGRWLLALPPTRVAGLQVLVRSLLAGTVPEVLEGPGVEAFGAATARLGSGSGGRRYTALVPTQLARLLSAGGPAAVEALLTYDAILLGGGPAHRALLDRARAAGLRVVTTYGMTETCGGCVYDGRPLDEVQVAVDDGPGGGRIGIGGPVVFSGYRLRPDLTREALVDGWHLTNDLGRLGPDGRLEVLGRVDEVVVSGGVNVPLPAVDEALAALPGVAEASAVGVPDPEWGTRVVAYVVLQNGAPAPSLADVRGHVSASWPRAYAPREVVVVEALPMLPSGKVDRAALRTRSGRRMTT